MASMLLPWSGRVLRSIAYRQHVQTYVLENRSAIYILYKLQVHWSKKPVQPWLYRPYRFLQPCLGISDWRSHASQGVTIASDTIVSIEAVMVTVSKLRCLFWDLHNITLQLVHNASERMNVNVTEQLKEQTMGVGRCFPLWGQGRIYSILKQCTARLNAPIEQILWGSSPHCPFGSYAYADCPYSCTCICKCKICEISSDSHHKYGSGFRSRPLNYFR